MTTRIPHEHEGEILKFCLGCGKTIGHKQIRLTYDTVQIICIGCGLSSNGVKG